MATVVWNFLSRRQTAVVVIGVLVPYFTDLVMRKIKQVDLVHSRSLIPVFGCAGFAYEASSKKVNQKDYNFFPPNSYGVIKGVKGVNTGSLKGSHLYKDLFFDDLMLRTFTEGIFRKYLGSEVFIKRRLNEITICFLVQFGMSHDLEEFYYLVGFSERLLKLMFGCIVHFDLQGKRSSNEPQKSSISSDIYTEKDAERFTYLKAVKVQPPQGPDGKLIGKGRKKSSEPAKKEKSATPTRKK